jgi:hypothetical protein
MNTDHVNTQMPAADRFEDRLLAAILADFGNLAGNPAGAASLARYRQARRSTAFRRAVPALLAGAAAVTVGVVGVAAFSGHTESSAGHPAAQTLAHPGVQKGVQTAAYMVDHMRAALNANTAVEVVLEHAPNSQTGKPEFDKTWFVPGNATSRSEELGPGGSPATGYVLTITAHKTVSIAINYTDHTWSKTVYPFGSASSPRSPAPQSETPEQSAAQLRAEVAAGKVTLVGPATVDGRKAVELREVSAYGLLDMWVDPATYLPIASIGTAPGMSPSSDQAIRDDYTWLPATPANLRLLTAKAAIPAGFTRVDG